MPKVHVLTDGEQQSLTGSEQHVPTKRESYVISIATG